jgi:hypothetical protein
MYCSIGLQKRRRRGYTPVTEVVDPQSLTRHGFEVTRYGRCPDTVERLLQDTYLRK